MASIYQFNSTENVWRITSIWRGYLYPRRKGIKKRIVNRNGGFHTITTKITRLNKQCSLITSNINGLNFPIKKKLTDWLRNGTELSAASKITPSHQG